MSEKKEMSFEEAMDNLEEIVEQLEEGDVPLEQAISIYKKGMDLSRLCHQKLKAVEDQMAQILQEDGELAGFSVQEEE
ncbi:exodeoxyribonuclease VII small subunit [Actinomycetes bacterium NPDC127524]|jgi:exodeoxyribonuclease VII small subunit|uniref:exodeoxyribonuclease VII small subunit n=1 Tax=Bacillaceae TaxID=186817 RepID=UPI0008F1A7FF|nr:MULTISPECIES: exodeoxyribonuclease VII small subunit [unclassified Bacillus (in: firmicutes)]OIK10132.1 exodeoxyribonuclease VII small subunit [Bacillus sp. MUM 13]SFC41803.1 Exodeoxyribonuclease VII small subunit [Bacillus sp. OV322]